MVVCRHRGYGDTCPSWTSYLAGVSLRRVEVITEALWGSRVSTGTLSKLNKKVYAKINDWPMLPIEGEYSYVYLDWIHLKGSWAGEIRNVAILVAIGINQDGVRETLGLLMVIKGILQVGVPFCDISMIGA